MTTVLHDHTAHTRQAADLLFGVIADHRAAFLAAHAPTPARRPDVAPPTPEVPLDGLGRDALRDVALELGIAQRGTPKELRERIVRARAERVRERAA